MALTDNIVSYWKLDEASGTRADSVGSNTLADNNTVLSAAGKINNAADFELANSESLSITNASQSGLGFTGTFSVSFWMYLESAADTNGTALLGKSLGTGNQRGYVFMAAPTALYAFFSPDGTDPSQQQATFSTTISATTWYHVVFVYTSGATESLQCYVNGSSVSTDTTFAQSIFSNTADFIIGASPLAGSYMDGLIDEVGVWSRALSGAEVTSLYNGGAGFTYPFSTASVKDIISSGFIPFAR